MAVSYHIYLREEVLFKDLSKSEFKVIWGRLFHSYYRDELTYEELNDIERGLCKNGYTEPIGDPSY